LPLSDVFISYAGEDKSFAEKINSYLKSKNISSWLYQKKISHVSTYPDQIVKAIKNCKAFIIVISGNANKSADIKNELKIAHDNHKRIIPFRVEDVLPSNDIAYFVGPVTYIDAFHPPFDRHLRTLHSSMRELLNSTTGNMQVQERVPDRATYLPIGGISIPLPCFFPSISSVKTYVPIIDHFRVLKAFKHPLFLVSAYDIHHSKDTKRAEIEKILSESFQSNIAILLDSGNYESYWKNDLNWKRSNFWSILKRYDYHLSFCFDRPPKRLEKTAQLVVNRIENEVLRDQEKAGKGTIIPIVHSTLEMMVDVVIGVVERLSPVMIALPERELGEGIITRAEVIFRIRHALNRKGIYYPIHLLGTGNPLSILVCVICGADSFDGLEWCQIALDHKRAQIYHFQQMDFLFGQSKFRSATVLPYGQAVLSHNLLFYKSWMHEIQQALTAGDLWKFAEKYLPRSFLKNLKKRLPEVLS
jgi:queuine/archaeosine tRNA-ribosyltransferase